MSLVKIPVVYEYSGHKDYVFVDTDRVNNIRPQNISVATGQTDEDGHSELISVETIEFHSENRYFNTTMTIAQFLQAIGRGYSDSWYNHAQQKATTA